MTFHEYRSICDNLLREAFGDGRGDGYFDMHSNRVHEWLVRFDLFKPLGNLLDIGPFFSLTPFLLQPNSSSVSVLEGDDPAADPLVKMYERRGIAANFTDLNELFGFPRGASRRLPYEDDLFDTILCWETMEHFSFNPVPFVKELGRIAKPDARIIVIVPDRASDLQRPSSVFREHAGEGNRRAVRHGGLSVQRQACLPRSALARIHAEGAEVAV
ncbi:MAG: methyltransferase domain-containing protein [Chthoniobacterales bacterium]|nr:methyltransferase domain-containing protein [Chthoniobacterales bacterium]